MATPRLNARVSKRLSEYLGSDIDEFLEQALNAFDI